MYKRQELIDFKIENDRIIKQALIKHISIVVTTDQISSSPVVRPSLTFFKLTGLIFMKQSDTSVKDSVSSCANVW